MKKSRKNPICTGRSVAARSKRTGAVLAFSLASLFGPALVSAQTPPDAGAVRQQIEQQRRNPLPAESSSRFEPPPPAMDSIGGTTVTVSQFRFVGNTLIANDKLAAAVAEFVGRPIDFAGLQNAAIAVATAYREAGWVVRAYLPQQELADDTVVIQIVEAKFGATRVEGETVRTSAARLERMVERQQKPGAPLSAAALDRSLLLIGDLPGVNATGRLAVGVNQAETDLVLDVIDGALVNGTLTADNAGSRFTGVARIVAAASLNSRLGIGDRADALLLHSEGNDYVSLGYSLPVGFAGWRIGAKASHLDYDIVAREFKALDAHGASNTLGLETTYPLLRTRLTNLYFALNVDANRFENSSGGVTTTDYEVQSATAGLYGNRYDRLWGGGATTASVLFTEGDVDLSGSPNQLVDSLTTRTEGSFQKVNFTFSRLQVVNESLSLFASLTGQTASRNLDSSERMYLGGSQAVRAYPENEAGGSEGMMANFEARSPLTQSITLISFIDWGQVRVNKDNDIPGAAPKNDLSLTGIGVSLGWAARFGLNLKGTYARRVGDNPNPTSNGNDQDGTLKENRFWIQAGMAF